MVKFSCVWVCVCQFIFLIELMMICYLSVRQLLQALPSRPLSNGYVQQKRLLSSPSSPKKEVLQSIKRYTKHTQRRNTDTNLTLTEVSLFVFFSCIYTYSQKGDVRVQVKLWDISPLLLCPLLSFRKSMSTERLTLVRREMGAESRSRTTSSSSSSGGKR